MNDDCEYATIGGQDEMKTMAMPTNENIIGAKNLPMGPELDLVVTLIFLSPVYTFRPAFRNFFCALSFNTELYPALSAVWSIRSFSVRIR